MSNIDIEEYKTELENLKDSLRGLLFDYIGKLSSNKERYILAYKTKDRETLDNGLGYERALHETIEDLEELLK